MLQFTGGMLLGGVVKKTSLLHLTMVGNLTRNKYHYKILSANLMFVEMFAKDI